MGILRSAFLAGSQNPWLRERATRYPFVRRSVSRFMPGERVEDALQAARQLQAVNMTTILTHLGENLTSDEEAESVTRHYLNVLDRVHASGLDAQISVKPTQLGLGLDEERCYRHLLQLVERASAYGNFVWVDMESTPYVDSTLTLFRRARKQWRNIGVCLQAYLYRTAADLESLLSIGPAIRLVKGAYKEPPSLAFPRKKDVDENYFRLALRLLGDEARRAGTFLGIATHDPRLIERLQAHIETERVPHQAYEYEMLYGIQRPLQAHLAQERRRIRILVSYGEYWFPWYMRRLAERPANVLFVARNLLSG